jgi:hypothetical protein
MLPFAHPIRLLLGSILPAILVVAVGLGPLRRIIAVWQVLIAWRTESAGTGAPAVSPEQFGLDILKIQGVALLALSLWLCAWQRAAARGFAEPIPRWLGGSLLRLPGYIVAFVIWLLSPAVVLAIPFAGLAWLITRLIAFNPGLSPPAQTPLDQAAAILGFFSDLQWWVIAAAVVTVALIALWLSARLSPLPALVASQGWRGTFGRAWQLSRGHGFGLSASLAGYTILIFLLLLISGFVYGAAVVARSGSVPDPGAAVVFASIVNMLAAALLAIWQASLGALVVRDGLSPADALDFTMFD